MDIFNPLLTIIVPAYNVEKYITDCLNSLVNQTLQNHKIIIVNDGSTDNTENICLEFKNRYNEIITYIYQENQGLSAARNTGLKLVDTPYLCFLDSDDWLNIRYVECVSQFLQSTEELPELIFTLPWVYDSVTKRIFPWKDKWLYDQIFEVNGTTSNVQTNSRLKPELYALEVTCCRKIYQAKFLEANHFFFPEGLKWEDVLGHFSLLHAANRCVALPEVGFFYRVNQGGQITSGGGRSRLDIIPIFQKLLEISRENHFNSIEKAYVLRLIVDFSMWSVEVTNKKYLPELLNGLHEIYSHFLQKEISFYLNTCSPNKEWESGFIYCLIENNYMKLMDYETRPAIIKEYSNLWISKYLKPKRNLIYGGIRCIYDHGLIYTVNWTIKKCFFTVNRLLGRNS